MVSSKTIPATKKPLVKNFEASYVFQYCPYHYRRKEIVSEGMREKIFRVELFSYLTKAIFQKSGGAHVCTPHLVNMKLPIIADKEIENKFLVFGDVKMLQEHEYISFILSSEVHKDEAPIFFGCRELF